MTSIPSNDGSEHPLDSACIPLPEIQVNDRQLREVTSEVIDALRDYNRSPKLFARSGRAVQIIRDERGRYLIVELGESALRGHMARCADYFRVSGNDKITECAPPLDVVRDILSLPPHDCDLLPLIGITEAPVLRPDGAIVNEPGYDPSTSLFYAPSPDLCIAPVPCCPSTADVTRARDGIRDVLEEFPFVDQASYANAVAALLTPICRPAIEGPVPLGIIDATVAGSGKTLLTEIISICATGRPGALFSAPCEDEEWRKQITSALREGAATIVIDNVARRLDSAELCKALTEITRSDRLLGKNELLTLPVRCSWYATGNNVAVGGDMPRRAYWVRLDPEHPQPHRRTGFRHADLKAWVRQNRGELLQGMLTLARAWIAAGRPAPTIAPLGSFENWSITIGGILQHAGISGFLANSDERYAEADAESTEWEGFLLTLRELYPELFSVSDIIRQFDRHAWSTQYVEPPETQKLRAALPDFIAEASDRPGFFTRRLGNAFRLRVGRRFGASCVYIDRAGFSHHAVQWQVKVPF